MRVSVAAGVGACEADSMQRRAFLLGLAVAALGCKRATDRCEFCGMKIDPTSPWLAELVSASGTKHRFDTPKCALLAWRTGKVPAQSARFQEYYDRTWLDGASLVFAVGSDVVGPMGEDAIPVNPARSSKFAKDHGKVRILRIDDLTAEALQAL